MDDPEAFVDGLRVADSDIRVHKKEMNSFLGSDLFRVLRDAGAECVVLVGLVAHLCVLSTYYCAFDLGFSPVILEGAVAATDEANVERVEAICRTVTLESLSKSR
ncbi:MAG: cysteine hydrolase [Candidatus Methanomethylophilaceae archaeon]|nr:cysteine hydrolase [Candidatus Methanomethylophilaceae archaeon]